MATVFAEGEEEGRQLAVLVKRSIASAVAPLKTANEALQARIAELEESAKKPPEIDLTGVEKLIQAEIAKISAPEPVKEIGYEEIATMVSEAVAAIPAPQDGKSVTVGDVAPLIAEEVAKATDPRDINLMVEAEVSKAVAAIPMPQNGKDAAGIVEALKDNGELVLTLQDGRLIRTGIRDGIDGKQGDPGFSLDDFDIERGEDGRSFTLKFERGDVRHTYEMTFPSPVYCGVWKESDQYAPGDLVTWAGSTWHCNRDDPGKPDTKDSGWQLMVKKGRDGRDYQPKDAKNG